MTDRTHSFKVGQTVDLIQSTFRSAASGHYEIISQRPAVGETRNIESRAEANPTTAPSPKATSYCRRIENSNDDREPRVDRPGSSGQDDHVQDF
jgi:hypothetical protein